LGPALSREEEEMDEGFLSIQDGKEEEIKLIKFKKQCPYCREGKTCSAAEIIDPVRKVYEIRYSKCGREFRIPVDDYNGVNYMVE
jgi:hypothetical protein